MNQNPHMAAQTASTQLTFWREFFRLYESLPVLWDVQHVNYKYREFKCDAYDKLVHKLREIEPKADRHDVLRRINIFRTNFRRERARVLSANKMGKNYKSTLWYYDMLHFLHTQGTRKRKCTNMLNINKNEPLSHPNESWHAKQEWSSNLTMDSFADESNCTTETTRIYNELDQHHSDFASLTFAEQKQRQHQQEQQQQQVEQQQQQQVEQQKQQLQQQQQQAIDATERLLLSPKLEISEQLQDESPDLPVAPASSFIANLLSVVDAKSPESPKSLPTSNVEQPLLRCLEMSQCAGSSSTATTNPIKTESGTGLSAASEILAKSWGIQYEEMAPDQKVYARKAIADILFQGCLGRLGSTKPS